jgi:hypothetical protein
MDVRLQANSLLAFPIKNGDWRGSTNVSMNLDGNMSTQVCRYGRTLYLQSLKVHFCNLIFAKATKFDEGLYSYLNL